MNENINNSYFDGYYKDIWRSVIPKELTYKEVDFIIQYFDLHPGDKILDLMCGFGRHALSLSEKGMIVTAVDNLEYYISELNEVAKKKNLDLRAIQTDVLSYKSESVFDLVICMGNSINFFPAKDTQLLLTLISSQIKVGGYFLINSWSLAEIAIKQFIEKSWAEVDGMKILTSCEYLFSPTRIEAETTIISSNKIVEQKKAIDYIFSISEIECMLSRAGFSLKEIYSIPGKRKFKIGDPRAYIVAQKGE